MIRLKKIYIYKSLCILAVTLNGESLCYIDKYNQTPEICKSALTNCGEALEYVYDKTFDLCELAVQQDGLALQYVPIKTQKICDLAIKQNSFAEYYAKL